MFEFHKTESLRWWSGRLEDHKFEFDYIVHIYNFINLGSTFVLWTYIKAI